MYVSPKLLYNYNLLCGSLEKISNYIYNNMTIYFPRYFHISINFNYIDKR